MLKYGRRPLQILAFPLYRDGDKIEYCLFEREDQKVWQGIAGGVEYGEMPDNAALREAYEEAGIDQGSLIILESISSMPSFVVKKCFLEDNILIVKELAYGIEVRSKVIVLSNEHLRYEWLEYEDAYSRLHWDSNRTALWELNYRLKNKMI